MKRIPLRHAVASTVIVAIATGVSSASNARTGTHPALQSPASITQWCTQKDLGSSVRSGQHYPALVYLDDTLVEGYVNQPSTHSEHSATLELRNASSSSCVMPSDLDAEFSTGTTTLPLKRADLRLSIDCPAGKSVDVCTYGEDKTIRPGESAFVVVTRPGCAGGAYEATRADRVRLQSVHHDTEFDFLVVSDELRDFRACAPGHDTGLVDGDFGIGLVRQTGE